MKKLAVLTSFCIFILCACNNPIVIPADVAVTLPPNQDFILRATQTVAQGEPQTPSETPTPEPTSTATATITPSPSPTVTPTFTPFPTHKSPYPMAVGTPLIDSGFPTIALDNVNQIRMVFGAINTRALHSAISLDGKILFLSTTNGLFMYNRNGEMLGEWQAIPSVPVNCETCISTNSDGSRVALIVRNSGAWEAQVYEIQGSQAQKTLSLPIQASYEGTSNEASIAISPDNKYLAFKAGAINLRVIDLQSKLQVLGYDRVVDGIVFPPDGKSFLIHGGREMLFYKTDTWQQRANLLLPRENTPYTFSPDGKYLAVALATKLRIYPVANLQLLREIDVPPSNAASRLWEISFTDNITLAGVAIQWDSAGSTATVEKGKWNTESGEKLSFDTSTTASPDPLQFLWGTALPLPANQDILENGQQTYNAFRYVSEGLLLVNSLHSACWLKLPTAENTCFRDQKQTMFASDGTALVESQDSTNTYLKSQKDEVIIQTGLYPIWAINHSAEWAVVNTGSSADLYTKGKKLLQESIPGTPLGFAENGDFIVITALQPDKSTSTLTIIDKKTGKGIFQQKDTYLYAPLVMTQNGSIYYIQNELGQNQTVINTLDSKTRHTSEVTRIKLGAIPTTFTFSSTGLFAIGQEDGSITVISGDGGQSTSFQAAGSPIDAVAFSLDGRYIATESTEGLRIFAVLP